MEKPRILILEDDQNMRFVLNECLRREGYQGILAADAEECLEKFMEFRPAVVLLDYKIPTGTGLEV
ncbi:MAG: response regulator, partial [Deltaproteobacteria bacterium]|nr:response regulator [Deltaproteobacteria bacterium]